MSSWAAVICSDHCFVYLAMSQFSRPKADGMEWLQSRRRRLKDSFMLIAVIQFSPTNDCCQLYRSLDF